MPAFPRKLLSGLGAGVLAAGLMVVGAGTASASTSFTCSGGSVPGGTYMSLTITGLCSIDSGNVIVQHNLVLRSGAGLNGLFAGSSLSVGGNVLVGSHALLFVGCDPVELACVNDSTATQTDALFGNLQSWGAAAVVVHDSAIHGPVAINGGGAGFSCAPLFPGGPPDYTNFSRDTIGGDLTVVDLRTCWSGINGNIINGTVTWSDNVGSTLTGDANLVDSNSIGRGLNCYKNNPTPHLGDLTPILNTVGGMARGQCTPLAA